MTILITGSSRGIGLELTRQALLLGHTVYACARNPQKSSELVSLVADYPKALQVVTLDVSSDDSALKAAQQIQGSIDILINNAGVYLDSKAARFSELASSVVVDSFQTNSIGPMRVTKAMLPHLSKSAKVINITSLMGSIKDNAGGGAYAYRMSKTAFNMFSKCLSIEFPDFTVVSVHPGWVQTDMGGKGANTPIPESARGILDIALNARKEDSAKFYDFRKRELPW